MEAVCIATADTLPLISLTTLVLQNSIDSLDEVCCLGNGGTIIARWLGLLLLLLSVAVGDRFQLLSWFVWPVHHLLLPLSLAIEKGDALA